MTLGRCVLVPVANPSSVAPLLALAARCCDPDGTVVPLTVVPRHPDAAELAEAEQAVVHAEQIVAAHGVTATGRVQRASTPADGVLTAVREHDASLVMMGWRGRSSTTTVFGQLIDTVVGRCAAPLAVVRLGAREPERVLLPVSNDHLLPGGEGGLSLACDLAQRLELRTGRDASLTVLRTGEGEAPLPDTVRRLSDRVHHDRRRTHQAVAAAARADDCVVAAVAPTVSGLRAATTHLAWAAPDATLLVAIDPGPTEQGIVEAVGEAGRPAPAARSPRHDEVRIVVTAALPEDTPVSPETLEEVLSTAGRTAQLMTWWPAVDARPHVRATVTVRAATTNQALAAVMEACYDAPAFAGAELTYDLDREASPRALAVTSDDLTVSADDGDEQTASARPSSS